MFPSSATKRIAAAASCVAAIDRERFQQQARPNPHGAVIGLLLDVERGMPGSGLLIVAFRCGRIRAVFPTRVRTPRASFRRAVSAFLGHANVTTTARYLNVKDDYLQELIERKPLSLVK